jgi:hypothetical protein
MLKKEILTICEILPKAIDVEISLLNKKFELDVPNKLKEVIKNLSI